MPDLETTIRDLEAEEERLHRDIDQERAAGRPYIYLEDRILLIRREVMKLKYKIRGISVR